MKDRLKRSLRMTLLGLLVNAVFALTKLLAGLIGNSHALIADSVESLADVFSSVVVWRSLVLAAKPPDAEHPYGHGKAEPIAAAIVSTLLLLAAAGITIKSLQEIFTPGEGPKAFTLAVLLAVIFIKELLYRVVSREGSTLKSALVLSDAWHHRSDAITSLAAAIGISIALLGGKDYEAADDVAAIVAAGIIAWNGWRLLRPAMDELMDTTPDPGIARKIQELAAAVRGVEEVEKCLVRKMGYQLFVDMHVKVNPQMTVFDSHQIAHEVKNRVRRGLPVVRDVLVHIEPVSPCAGDR